MVLPHAGHAEGTAGDQAGGNAGGNDSAAEKPAESQATAEGAALRLAFGDFPPYVFRDENGARTGFSVELSQWLAQELGLPLEFVDTTTTKEFVQVLTEGRATLFTGIAQLPMFKDTMGFSDPVATETLRLMVLPETEARIAETGLTGLQIGVIPPAVGSHIDTLREDNALVEFAKPDEAVMALLTAQVDGVVAPNPTLFNRARTGGFDNRVSFVNPPLREIERFVALHNDQAALMPQINAALAAMAQDGRLDSLRAKYFIDLPEPQPEVLRVAAAHSPPWMVIEGGEVSGYAADIMQALAARSGVEITFVPTTLEGYFEGAMSASEDVIPVVMLTQEVREILDVTLPVRISKLAVLVEGPGSPVQRLSDLARARIGTFPDTRTVLRENGLEVGEVLTFEDFDQLAEALRRGAVDAIVETQSGLEGAGLTQAFYPLGTLPFGVENAIGLRPGLGALRERFNAVLPGFLLSAEFASIQEKYFGDPVFWTRARINLALGAICTVILVLLAALFWLRHRQRWREFDMQQAELQREQAYSRELGVLVTQLEHANREQAEFTYAISHDLKSPANTIGMLIEELGEVIALDAQAQEVLEDMAATNKHMRLLVDDVLSYANIVEGELSTEAVDLAVLVAEIRKDLAGEISVAGARLNCTELPVIRGNRTQLRMLLQNLISNAVKFRAPERVPLVAITHRYTEEGLAVTVADNGIGIAPEFRERVFGLFQRLNAHATYGGTGLGLTICQRVMSNHRGRISVEDGVDGGTAFVVWFPAEVIEGGEDVDCNQMRLAH